MPTNGVQGNITATGANGGQISVYSDSGNGFSAGGVTVTGNPSTNLSVTPSAGYGGQITLNAGSTGPILFSTSGTLSVNGTTSSTLGNNYNGGQISLTGSTIGDSGGALTLSAAGYSNGYGGSITVNASGATGTINVGTSGLILTPPAAQAQQDQQAAVDVLICTPRATSPSIWRQ